MDASCITVDDSLPYYSDNSNVKSHDGWTKFSLVFPLAPIMTPLKPLMSPLAPPFSPLRATNLTPAVVCLSNSYAFVVSFDPLEVSVPSPRGAYACEEYLITRNWL